MPMKTRIRDLLRRKGEDVYSVGPLSTVIDAVNIMNDHHVGSVLVMDAGYPVGIFSERDVLVRVVATHRDPTILCHPRRDVSCDSWKIGGSFG